MRDGGVNLQKCRIFLQKSRLEGNIQGFQQASASIDRGWPNSTQRNCSCSLDLGLVWFMLLKNVFFSQKQGEQRRQGENVWFLVFYCSQKHTKH